MTRATTPDGAPIAGAAVVLRHGARAVARATLDGAGRARFAGLVPGRYSLELEAGGLPAGLVVPPCAESCAESDATRVPFALERGCASEVGLLAVSSATVRGFTLAPEGAPVAGACVRLQALDPELGLASLSAESDEHGVFELRDVVPGSYRVQPVWPAGSAADAAPAPSEHRLEPGSFLALTLRGEREPRSIRGALVDPRGQAIAGLIVQCEHIESPLPMDAGEAWCPRPAPPAPWSRVLARARTDEDGRFLLAGLPSAEVVVRAAPRVGARLAFQHGSAGFEETSVGRFDLRATGPSLDAGTTVVRPRTRQILGKPLEYGLAK